MKKAKIIAIDITIAILIYVGIVVGYLIYRDAKEYAEDKAEYNNIADEVIISDNGEKIPDIDFTELKSINEDVVGWIVIPGTKINYPVVQGEDNFKYLKKLYTGRRSSSGSIFMDYRNRIGINGEIRDIFQDDNTILYGHHMRNGSIFGGLTNYKKQSFYDEHKIGYYITPEGKYKLEIFASYVSKASGDWTLPNFGSDNFDEIIENMRSKSDIKTDTVLNYGDRIMTLSTCTYNFKNARYVVHARIKKVSETP